MRQEIEQPVIIFGTGRSGTTILHRMLSTHPNLAWLPGRVCNKYPARPEVARLALRALDLPVVGSVLRDRFEPGECYAFWEHHFPGFSTPFRDLTASDLTSTKAGATREGLARILSPRRSRLLLKVTGWPRLGLLSALFPDARFVHVLRDGRAVANSLLEVDFWLGWRGPGNWRWGPLGREHTEEWEHTDRSFVVLAAIQWKILMDALEASRETVDSGQLLEVRYEQLCEHPVQEVQRIAEFAGLRWSGAFDARIRSFRLKNSDFKWKSNLSRRQKDDLHEVLREHLLRYGYA